MAIGDTLRPELLRSDTSGILRGGIAAGAAAERGLGEFGETIGAAWRDIEEKKQKKRDEGEIAQAIQRFDPNISSEDAAAMSRSKIFREIRAQSLEQDRLDEQAAELSKYRGLQIKEMERDQAAAEAQRLGMENFVRLANLPTETPETERLRQEQQDQLHPETGIFAKARKTLSEVTGVELTEEQVAAWLEGQEARNAEALAASMGPSAAEANTPGAFGRIAREAQGHPYVQQAAMKSAAGAKAEGLARQKMALEERKVGIAEKGARLNLTVAEEAMDRKFGTEIADYAALGGVAAVDRNIIKLDNAAAKLRQALSSGENLTGWEMQIIPEVFQNWYNPNITGTKEMVESVIQTSLRETLGAQFAEREGAQFLRRGYNPNLPEEKNLKNVLGLLDEIKDRAQAKRKAYDYYNTYGTLKGYTGLDAGSTSASPTDDGRLRGEDGGIITTPGGFQVITQ
jgi:hypothetical protein